ncbi:MAG TPA: hypothetical protein VFY18_07490 [Candidatus Limnocylindrales bacterium]|nr:hypothetical protein [Candidatus Limnocylindrales bacterium]
MDQHDVIDLPGQAGDPLATTTSEPGSATRASTMKAGFLNELARAMHASAEREREHIGAVISDEAAEHVEKARTRGAVEAEELRRLAEEDVDGIQSWAAAEMERIRLEAGRRTDERRNDLKAFLARHDSIISTEIDGVGLAVRDYRLTLDQFFDELTSSNEPAEIARRAGSIPMPPDLDDVRGAARADAVAQYADAPYELASEPVSEPVSNDLSAGVETESPVMAVHDAAPDGWPDAEAGLGVMDPDAIGRSNGVPDVLQEVDAEASDGAAPSSEEPELVPAGHEGEADVAETGDRSSAAVRLLRSIAPWTVSAEHDESDRGTDGR